jgi:hypothetical protein
MNAICFFAALALVAGVTGARQAAAMSYGLASHANGSTAVVAQGRIHRNEAMRLLSFLQASGVGTVPRTLVISSAGGELVGALALGQTLRRLGIRTVVGSIGHDEYGRATVSAGRCHSACVFVLMGGVARSVLPGSLVGVHAPQPVFVSGGRAYIPDEGTTRYLVPRTAPMLRLYARQMGVSPRLVDVAHVVPHTTVRALSSSELARYSVGTRRRKARARPSLASGMR